MEGYRSVCGFWQTQYALSYKVATPRPEAELASARQELEALRSIVRAFWVGLVVLGVRQAAVVHWQAVSRSSSRRRLTG